jgi:hypothetical protein
MEVQPPKDRVSSSMGRLAAAQSSHDAKGFQRPVQRSKLGG